MVSDCWRQGAQDRFRGRLDAIQRVPDEPCRTDRAPDAIAAGGKQSAAATRGESPPAWHPESSRHVGVAEGVADFAPVTVSVTAEAGA